MNILRVAQTCYPDVTGGGAYHVHAMSRDQAAMGHDVTVLTVRQDPDLPHVEERAGYTLVRYDPTVSALGNALSIGLARYLRHATSDSSGAGDVDVVHAHSHLYASTNLAALRRWLGGPPLAITNHGLYSQTAPELVFDGYLRTVGRWTFDQADVVFCYTDVDERRLRDLGVTSEVAVVPNGVDTERFRPDGPEIDLFDGTGRTDGTAGTVGTGQTGGMAGTAGPARTDGTEGPIVLFVGRLVDGKRPQDAVAAMEQVREVVPGARLALCGDGPLREELERQASEAFGDAVRFLGHVDYDEMPAIYRSADALVLPSRAEGMPRTVLEARASGIPVVTTDLEHVAAGTDPGVRTVPVENVDAIATALVAALSGEGEGDRDAPAEPGAGDDPVTQDAGDDSTAPVARNAEPPPGTALEVPSLQGDGGRSVPLEDGRSRDTAPGGSSHGSAADVQGADRSAADEDAPAREALDWRSTVRETTSVLERLVATTDSHR